MCLAQPSPTPLNTTVFYYYQVVNFPCSQNLLYTSCIVAKWVSVSLGLAWLGLSFKTELSRFLSLVGIGMLLDGWKRELRFSLVGWHTPDTPTRLNRLLRFFLGAADSQNSLDFWYSLSGSGDLDYSTKNLIV